ncbi:MAG: response regulator [Ignavibacteriae bacterium]|nr:response regulator [Ignavibacteriota bacterium]
MKPRVERIAKVLVVDDEDAFRMLIAQTLGDEGFQVHEVSNGEDAVHAIRERSFDLALLDMKMPRMDGIEVLKAIRKESPLTECIMITGYKDINLAVDAIKLGAKEFLTKPVNPAELVHRVKSVLRAHMAEAQVKGLQEEFTSKLLLELLSPLHSVSTAVEFLTRGMAGQVTSQQKDTLKQINENLNKMDAMLNDMIDLTLFESGHVEIEKLPTNLDELIPTICAQFKPQATAKKITLAVDVRKDIPTIALDAGKIEQVLTNLIENGIKYTQEGGTIRVSATMTQQTIEDKKRDFVVVTVSDTGVGIPKEELPYVFDKYKEFFTGKTSAQKTTGIGLAICRSIVQAHHGTMDVESEVGKGSTFKFLLPIDSL